LTQVRDFSLSVDSGATVDNYNHINVFSVISLKIKFNKLSKSAYADDIVILSNSSIDLKDKLCRTERKADISPFQTLQASILSTSQYTSLCSYVGTELATNRTSYYEKNCKLVEENAKLVRKLTN
jgi:hypothetical protein